MKIYLSKDIRAPFNKKTSIEEFDMYLALNGIYIFKNNKILRYILDDNDMAEHIQKYVSDVDIYCTNGIVFDNEYNNIPTNNKKISIKRQIFYIDNKCRVFFDEYDNIVEKYIVTKYKINDMKLKTHISNLI
jgi:hypothetical protein